MSTSGVHTGAGYVNMKYKHKKTILFKKKKKKHKSIKDGNMKNILSL